MEARISPAVRITGVFDRAFAARGLYPVYPQNQDAMLACIKAVKAARRSDTAIELLQNAALELMTARVDLLLVACSELSLIKDSLPDGINVVDSIDVLADCNDPFYRQAKELLPQGTKFSDYIISVDITAFKTKE